MKWIGEVVVWIFGPARGPPHELEVWSPDIDCNWCEKPGGKSGGIGKILVNSFRGGRWLGESTRHLAVRQGGGSGGTFLDRGLGRGDAVVARDYNWRDAKFQHGPAVLLAIFASRTA